MSGIGSGLFVTGVALAAALGLASLRAHQQAEGSREFAEAYKAVAAFEIPVKTEQERAALTAMLRRRAATHGAHLDDSTEQWRSIAERGPPSGRKYIDRSISVGAWRGEDDEDLQFHAGDAGHHGQAWLIFSNGRDPELAERLRRDVVRELEANWPQARRLVVANGTVLPAEAAIPSTSEEGAL